MPHAPKVRGYLVPSVALWLSIVAAFAIGCGGTSAEVDEPEGSTGATLPGESAENGGLGASGTHGAGGTARSTGCCYNDVAFACPTMTACFGGFDGAGCMTGCKNDPDCILACATRMRALRGPTGECKRLSTPCN